LEIAGIAANGARRHYHDKRAFFDHARSLFMADLSNVNPTGRFSGLEELYAKHRPSYPADAIDFIIRRCGLDGTTTLVDVGCGTGISTRLFTARGIPVIGIEPNDAMRLKAEAEPVTPESSAAIYRKGTGEDTGLAAASATAVLAAQAFHWFDAPVALKEFHRILRPGGHAMLMWNERDAADLFTAAYGTVIRSTPGAAAVEGPRGRAGEAILHSEFFDNAELTTFTNSQELDEEGLIGRSMSASYAPREPAEIAKFTAALRQVFAAHRDGDRVRLRYVTSVYSGQRREGVVS
jgi:SAM-dependent methyltransferase